MQITLSQLESHLWESANILRGPVDAADFKTYIFPLLFFKRICDVWDEEYDEIVDETGDAELALFPETHRFQIPEDCHWNDVRADADQCRHGPAARHARDREGQPGHALRRLRRCPVDQQGSAVRCAAQGPDRALLASCRSATSNVNSDMLGDAYEYLIKKFADATNKKAGEFYTPRSVVRLMVDILDPKEGETIYDPACGTGGMLLGAVAARARNGGDVEAPVGQALRPGEEPHHLVHRPHEPVPARHRGLPDRARRHAAQPGLLRRRPAWPPSTASSPIRRSRWRSGARSCGSTIPSAATSPACRPPASGDFAWVQHMVKSMAEVTGRMAVVLPQGALFRKGAEGGIRQKLLEMDLIEAVIGLAPNLFYGTGLAACILVLRKTKPAERQQEGADRRCLAPVPHGPGTELPGARARRARSQRWFASFADVQDAVRVVTLDEIKAEDWTLNISRYVLPPMRRGHPATARGHRRLQGCARRRCRDAEDRLRQGHDRGRLAAMSARHLPSRNSSPTSGARQSCCAA